MFFLRRIPATEDTISSGISEGKWWVKLQVLIERPLAWHVVQELGCVLNYLPLNERLGTALYPVSLPTLLI